MLKPLDIRGHHGHVLTNPMGGVARCGGPSICPRCQREWYEVYGELHLGTSTQTVVSWAQDMDVANIVSTYLLRTLGTVVLYPYGVLDTITDGAVACFSFMVDGELRCNVGLAGGLLELDPECI